MKHFFPFLLAFGFVVGVNGSEYRDTTINIYGVKTKVDKNQESSNGLGVMFESEEVKVKLEGTSDFIKSGAIVKFNPFYDGLYIKVGANYINQKVYAPDSSNTRVDQYSGALAFGYMLRDDLYAEMGGSYTRLDGKLFGDYEIKDEDTSLAYVELAKRWESDLGTLDTTLNGAKVFYEYKSDESSLGVGVDYYPLNNTRLSYMYQYEKDNIYNYYAIQYSLFFASYTDNISKDTYAINAGVKVAFGDIFDISTYKAPTKIKYHLSELHKFESITFDTNFQLQSTAGVQKSAAALAEQNSPLNHAPKWTQSSYDTGLTIRDDNDDPKTIMDLTSVSSDADGDSLSYSIVSISTPNINDDIPWENSLYIENGVLKAKNLVANDPDFNGAVSVVVKVSDGTNSSNTTVNFDFLNYQ